MSEGDGRGCQNRGMKDDEKLCGPELNVGGNAQVLFNHATDVRQA